MRVQKLCIRQPCCVAHHDIDASWAYHDEAAAGGNHYTAQSYLLTWHGSAAVPRKRLDWRLASRTSSATRFACIHCPASHNPI